MNAGYKQLKDEYAFDNSGSANQSTSKLFQSLILFQQQLSEQTTIITGFNYQNRAIVSNDRGIHSLNIAAPFVSLSQNIGSRFYVQPSLRAEFIENNKAELLPQLNASYHIRDFQFRASGGRTIRAAEFTELYNNYGREKGKLVGPSIGNPGLTPEIAWAYEAGFDWFYRSQFKLSSTFFNVFIAT
ncbi:TonB-dependent receptor domain-containing protein [Niabella ginsengisoli]|uniref:TonB-dependent receptor n=1 Tax=Niabella ginsengisoli TaxID=522298 RepID=A0ABS9SMV8_9BACT|nr:TonB-dependent receptor [Niabella ginsengisoli]MCH5599715.1 TonB-dependent receptor [Niabella ginsengisoli]